MKLMNLLNEYLEATSGRMTDKQLDRARRAVKFYTQLSRFHVEGLTYKKLLSHFKARDRECAVLSGVLLNTSYEQKFLHEALAYYAKYFGYKCPFSIFEIRFDLMMIRKSQQIQDLLFDSNDRSLKQIRKEKIKLKKLRAKKNREAKIDNIKRRLWKQKRKGFRIRIGQELKNILNENLNVTQSNGDGK